MPIPLIMRAFLRGKNLLRRCVFTKYRYKDFAYEDNTAT